MYIRIAFSIELRLRVSRSLRSLANYNPPCITFIGERAKRARHYQGCTNSSCAVYVYIHMHGGTYAIIVAHAAHT